MDFSSFWTSLGTSFLIFVVLMLLYTWLSRKPENAMVYYPNRILKDMEPWEGGSRTRNPFAWIQEALSSSEQDVIAMSGVDTAVYFVFLNTVLGILVLSGLVLLPVLLPVAATNHAAKATNTSSGSFILSMENIEVNKIWEELEGHRKKLALAEAIYAKSKSTGKPEGARLTNGTGFLGLFGKKVDSKESKSTGKPEGARPNNRTGFRGFLAKKQTAQGQNQLANQKEQDPLTRLAFLVFLVKK